MSFTDFLELEVLDQLFGGLDYAEGGGEVSDGIYTG